jgi:hypothetical protein
MPGSNSPQEKEEENDSKVFTEETDVRVKWLGSALSAFVITGFFGLVYAVSFGYATFEPITASMFTILALLVLAAGTWTFGIDLIDKYTGK